MATNATYDLDIIDYDTSHLDALEGHVSDAPAIPTAAPLTRRTADLVLPARPHPAAGVLGQIVPRTDLPPTNGAIDAIAIQHMQSMSERSTPVERTWAKLIQYGGWVLIAGIVVTGLVQAGLDSVMGWLLFVSVFAYGIYRTNSDENDHSPAGVERHKTDGYVRIRQAEIRAQDRANARSHETFAKVLDQVYGGR